MDQDLLGWGHVPSDVSSLSSPKLYCWKCSSEGIVTSAFLISLISSFYSVMFIFTATFVSQFQPSLVCSVFSQPEPSFLNPVATPSSNLEPRRLFSYASVRRPHCLFLKLHLPHFPPEDIPPCGMQTGDSGTLHCSYQPELPLLEKVGPLYREFTYQVLHCASSGHVQNVTFVFQKCAA